MKSLKSGFNGNTIDRRQALTNLAVLATAIGFGCTPISKMSSRFTIIDKKLRAFMEVIVPGIDRNAANLTDIFYDEYYPLAKYTKLLVRDLSKKSKKYFGSEDFQDLSIRNRTPIIQEGLQATNYKQQIYQGAVLLAQLSVYTGLYKIDEGCQLIDFPGKFDFNFQTHPDYTRFMGQSITSDGNPQ